MGRVLVLSLFFAIAAHAEISALYLTWYGDPTTTMAIQWHTQNEEPSDSVHLETLDGKWYELKGSHTFLDQILVHSLFLEHLDSDTEYSFRIGNDPTIYKFRTAPHILDKPIRFIVGGDVCCNCKLFRRMNKTVVENDPLFAVLGGDIAYAIHTAPFRTNSAPLRRWLSFLKDWKDQMKTHSNRLIPFVLVPGNHDIEPDNYELFFKLFAFPNKQLYRTLNFGSYLSLFLLDTGHFQPIEGRQTLWLEEALEEVANIPYRFAIYHQSAYPSYYPYHGAVAKKIRSHWAPLFEKHGILAAFENHNHAYKRTYPIKANQIDKHGVVYLGDGSWGAAPRNTNDAWYLDKKARKNAVFLVELTAKEAHIKALDLFNTLFDELKLNPIH